MPEITIEQWPTMALPKEEIKATLQYLAFKARRPVTFRPYCEGEGYSGESVSVRVGVSAGDATPHMTSGVVMEGQSYELAPEQMGLSLPHIDDEWDCIEDEKGQTIGLVDRNRIIFPIEITASDNEAARVVLAYVIERAAALLDFDVTQVMKEQEAEFLQSFAAAFQQGAEAQLEVRQQELRDKTYEAEQAYHTVVDFERQKPCLEEEIALLSKLADRPNSGLARKQASAILELKSTGLYSDVTFDSRGQLTAVTSAITIEHDGYDFPLGRYQVEIRSGGEIIILALDPHPRASYPHPHVATDGRPCLGSASGDVARLIGRLRLAEALQLLHAFLSSYNGENPFERIGRFDPDGAYSDESEDACEDCDEKATAYCICSCDNNDGAYSCEDCYDARTDSCYRECSRNEDYAQYHPCDGCSRRGSNDCYLECQYNEEWELQDPCPECEEEDCVEADCSYLQKRKELGHVQRTESRQTAPAAGPGAEAASRR